ncbi:hypothetical protein WOLCODRAFT_123318 [Wolfiporia cocos MD-104 SS10]|uniref:Uncharacterized protein n=1 Tax=Wolfiporia cocos (strain MD-104) TaxID=742152 RepID=A0A2H3K2C7_WOLCO|nr:hypothetical protein WOLCODRAFT_123318 [Wolfiporia cocos MD-104 SS10]
MSSIMNARASIAVLPDDLIQEIFELVVCSAFRIAGSNPHSQSECDSVCSGDISHIPIQLSHVCRYWRHLALSYPKLWSYHNLSAHSSRFVTRQLLARSGNSPLYAKIVGPRTVWESTEALVRLALDLSLHAHRFAEVFIVHFLPETMKEVLAPFATPAPNLRYLVVDAEVLIDHRALFLGWMPSLREICISNVRMPWPPLSNLCRLELLVPMPPSFPELYKTMEQSPQLEVLSLVFDVLSSSFEPFSAPRIELPKLRKLSLSSLNSHSSGVLLLLSHLAFPATTEVKIHLPVHATRHLSDLCPSLQSIASRIEDLDLQYSSSYGENNIFMQSTSSPFRLWWCWEGMLGNPASLDHMGLAAAAFPSLRSLAVRVYSFDTYIVKWAEVLKHAPSIEHLRIDFQSFRDVTARCLLHGLTDDTDGSVNCPKLSHLELLRFTDHDADLWPVVLRAMTIRKSQGAPVRFLEVTARRPLEFALADSMRCVVDKFIFHRKD